MICAQCRETNSDRATKCVVCDAALPLVTVPSATPPRTSATPIIQRKSRFGIVPVTLAAAVVIVSVVLGGQRLNEWRKHQESQARTMAQETEHWGECGVPILCALWQGDKNQASALLENGASANARSSHGNTALMWAVAKGDVELTRQLLQRDADPNAHNDSGHTALMTASFAGHIELMRLLLDSGARPNDAAQGGDTPLMAAAFSGNLGCVQLLLDHGADPAQKDKKDHTALYFAGITGHTAAAELLAARQGLRINVQTDPNAPLNAPN